MDPFPCWRDGCTSRVAVQWRRRPTDTELRDVVAAEQALRNQIATLSDPAKPTPVFEPLPTAADTVLAVHSCSEHALGLDLAAQVHAADCTADMARLPGCACTPEPLPTGPVHEPLELVALPTGWTVAAS